MTAAPGNCDTISQTVKLNENVLITFLATATVSNVNLKCYLLQRPNQRWLEQGLWNEPPPAVQIALGPGCVASGQWHCLSVPQCPHLETGDLGGTHLGVAETGERIHTE